MQEKVLVENTQFENLEPSTASEESTAEIHTAPYLFSSPLDLSLKKASQTIHKMRAYKEGMKYKPYLPDEVKCPKLFEVDGQINPILQIFDELVDRPAERRRNSSDGLVDGQLLKIYVV